MRSSDLAEAIGHLDLAGDGESLTEVLRLRDRLDARIAMAVAAFDRNAVWALDDATSATAWLRQHAGLTAGAAANLALTSKRLLDAPALAAAWVAGEVSGGQVQAVVAQLNDRVAPLFAEQEAGLVPLLAPLSVRETAIVMQEWRARADALVDDGDGDGDGDGGEPERALFVSRTLGGRAELKGSLDPAAATVVETALRVATTRDDEGDDRLPAERRADALVDVCRHFLDHHHRATTTRHRPHVNVVVTLDDLERRGPGRTLDGDTILDTDTIAALLCDADVHRVLTDGRGTILDHGRATRTVSPGLFSALALRDGHCRLVEGCDRPPTWCEAHHVVPWEDGGETKLSNLVLACSRHHHTAHRRRWRQTLEADGTYTAESPDGRSWTTHPRGAIALPLAIAG